MQKAHEADFAGFGIEFDNYGSTNSPENREVCAQIWAEIRKAGLVEEQQVTQLYDAQAGTFLADRFVKGTCPKCSRRASTATIATSAAPITAHRADRPGEHALGQQAGNPPGRPPVHQHREAARVSRRVDPERRAPSARDRQLSEGPLPVRAAARLGRLAAGAVLRVRDSRQSRQLLVRLVRCADRLHRFDGAVVQAARRETRRLVARRRADGNPPLHRQGHHLFSHAVLAGHAQDRRPEPAGEGSHPRVPDRRRREDVEEQGDVHPGVDLPRTSRPVVLAILLRLEAVGGGGRHRPELRGFHRQGQFRSGRQGREHRQPNGEVCREDGAGRRVGEPRVVRPGGARRRGNRRRLRKMRLQPGDAADHGRGRSRQRLHRLAQAVGTGQEGRCRRRNAMRRSPAPPA